MPPVMFVVDVGVQLPQVMKTIKKDIMKIPGVVEVPSSSVTGHVGVIGTTDAATLGELLETKLMMPVFFLADFGAPPAGGGCNPYVSYRTLPYAKPPPEPEAAYLYTPFGGSPSKDEEVRRGPVVFAVDMGVRTSTDFKKMSKDLMKISGVVEICPSFVTGHVGVVGMTDAATLKALLETKLSRPAFLIADFGAAPAPRPVGRGGFDKMPPPPVGVHYNPYVRMIPPLPVGAYYNPHVGGYNRPHYAAPPPQAGYYSTLFGGRPWGPGPPPHYHYTPNDAPAASFGDDIFEDEPRRGWCCFFQ